MADGFVTVEAANQANAPIVIATAPAAANMYHILSVVVLPDT